MGRPLRNWRCGEVYHVYQRGNDRREVFLTRGLYLLYIQRMFLMAKRYAVRVHAFCCMPNHVHMILEPTRKGGLSHFMRDLQSGYSRMLHQPRNRDGHSWKAHFGCKRLGAQHYRTAMWYVEYNPVKAGLAKRAEDWEFSSAKAHVTGLSIAHKGKRKHRAIQELYGKRWREEFANVDWRAWLRNPAEEDLRLRIREVEQVLGPDKAGFGAVPKAPNHAPTPPELPAKPFETSAALTLTAPKPSPS